MEQRRTEYLVRLGYLGFRYSGWQKQPEVQTVESMLLKTLKFILPGRQFKILGAGRTDAKVSALDAAFSLFLEGEPLENLPVFMDMFNRNLPPDIRINSMAPVVTPFNIIQSSRLKSYTYLFSFGAKQHPFCAPFMANFLDDLDLKAMVAAASLYEGTHNFRAYTARPQENMTFERTVEACWIAPNNLLTASFFPAQSYALQIKAQGFLRYQVRLIMGALVQLGKGVIDSEFIRKSLEAENDLQINYVAPGSGLLLSELEFGP